MYSCGSEEQDIYERFDMSGDETLVEYIDTCQKFDGNTAKDCICLRLGGIFCE